MKHQLISILSNTHSTFFTSHNILSLYMGAAVIGMVLSIVVSGIFA